MTMRHSTSFGDGQRYVSFLLQGGEQPSVSSQQRRQVRNLTRSRTASILPWVAMTLWSDSVDVSL